MTLPSNQSSVSNCEQLKDRFHQYCERSSIIYCTKEGWITVVQPLDIFFSYKSKPYENREQAWLKTRLMLAASFLAELCKNNNNLVVSINKEKIVSTSPNLIKLYGNLAGLDLKECINELFLPNDQNIDQLNKLDNYSYFIEIAKLLNGSVYELEINNGLSYEILQTVYSTKGLNFTDTLT